MEDRQEVIGWIKERLQDRYSDPYEVATEAADMFELWEDDPWRDKNKVEVPQRLPEWLLKEAEDIFFDG
jgi:hypothetical protein